MRTVTLAACAATSAALVASTLTASPAWAASWSVVTTPNPGTWDSRLLGTDAVSATDAWAVGSYSSGTTRTLAARWNGTSWSTVGTPSLSGEASLRGVDLAGASTGWAVGSVGSNALIERWNGTSWTVVPGSAPPGTTQSDLRGVKTFSATSAWAVGTYATSSGSRNLIERWNGTSWSVSASPSPDPNVNFLVAVDGTSGSDVWAVGNLGTDGYGGSTSGAVLRWNGSTWTRQTLPSGDGKFSITELRDVVAVASNDVWAVGSAFSWQVFGWVPYWLHWNGSNWQHGTIPSPPAGGSFNGVTALSSTKVYAFGTNGSGSSLIRRWNGTTWTNETAPPGSGHSPFDATAAAGTGTVLAVGLQFDSNGNIRTLGLRTANG